MTDAPPRKKVVIVLDDVRNYPFDPEAEEGQTFRTAAECLVYLGVESGVFPPIDELWLDFDLGGEFGRTELFETASPVVTWLSELAYYGRPYPVGKIVIHTANPWGRDSMKLTLERYGYNVETRVAHFHV